MMLVLQLSLLLNSTGVQIGYLLNKRVQKKEAKKSQEKLIGLDNEMQMDFYQQMKTQFDTENAQVNLRRAIKPIKDLKKLERRNKRKLEIEEDERNRLARDARVNEEGDDKRAERKEEKKLVYNESDDSEDDSVLR
jgi:hypothetical protein